MRTSSPWLIPLILIATGVGWASDEPSGDLEAKLERIAVFKNGVGAFSARASVPASLERALLSSCVAPSHGTLWIDAEVGVKLRSLVSRRTTTTTEIQAPDLHSLLALNQGLHTQVWLDDGSMIDGIIEPVGYEAGEPKRDSPTQRLTVPPKKTYLMLVGDDGSTVIDSERVVRVAFDAGGESISTRFKRSLEQRQLEVEFGTGSRGGDLAVSYLGRGIAWAPSYRIDISGQGRAVLDRKAVVINEACDLDEVDILLVTGQPTLQFVNVQSPLGLGIDLNNFLRALGAGGNTNVPQTNQARYMMSGSGGASSRSSSELIAVSGETVEDLFVESLGEVSLKRGEVAYFPIRRDEVDFRHVYLWEIPDLASQYSRSSQKKSGSTSDYDEVWHSLRLVNDTSAPWTEAPILVVKGPEVVAQSSIPYTSAGGTAVVHLSRAFAVEAEQVEREIARTREVEKVKGYAHDRIELEGVLRIVNHYGAPIQLEVTKVISGELITSTPVAKSEALARGLKATNQTLFLSWELDLGPGDERQVTYTYSLLVR